MFVKERHCYNTSLCGFYPTLYVYKKKDIHCLQYYNSMLFLFYIFYLKGVQEFEKFFLFVGCLEM